MRSSAAAATALFLPLLLVIGASRNVEALPLRSTPRSIGLDFHRLSMQTTGLVSDDARDPSNHSTTQRHVATHLTLSKLRGGAKFGSGDSSLPSEADAVMRILDTINTALISGEHVKGVLALVAIAAATTLLPTLLVKQSYAFVIGCGLSTITMATLMASAFGLKLSKESLASSPSHLLVLACMVHGTRLASIGIARDLTSTSVSRDAIDVGQDGSSIARKVIALLKRIPLSLCVAVLYAFQVSPVLYALRGADTIRSSKVESFATWAGVCISYVGVIIGGITDLYKCIIECGGEADDKQGDANKALSATGTDAAFNISRHLNYLGEGLFWIGLYTGGISSFGSDAVAWICGTLGLSGIVVFMILPWIFHLVLSQIKYDHEGGSI